MAQILFGGSSATIAASLNQFASLMGWMAAWSASDAVAYTPIPTGGTLSMLTLRPSGSPVTTTTITLLVNGVASLLTCNTNSATIAHDNVHTISVVAGDKVSVQISTSGGATARFYSFSMKWTPTINGENIQMGTSNNSPAVSTRYTGVANATVPSATETNVRQIIPETGTFKKLYVNVDTDPTVAATNVIFTVHNQSVASSLAATVAAGSTSGNDTVNSFAMAAAGNHVSLRVTVTGAPTLSPYHWGMVYVTPTSGNFLVLSSTAGNTLSLTTSFVPPGAYRAVTTNETTICQMVSNAFTAVGIWSQVGTAPGVGNSWNFFLRDNAADTALVVNIAGTSTANSASGSVTVNADELIDFKEIVGAGTPTLGLWKVALIGNLADPVTTTTISKLALLGVG